MLCLSLLIIGMDNTILNVALPRIQEELSATGSQLQWIVDSYVIVYASLLLTTGSLGDRFGRKGALAAGLTIFGVGSFACAFATTANQLIAARAFAGIGGALIMPATLSILTNVFPAEERGKAIGIWAGVSGLGIVIGPLTGGWLLSHYHWGAVFLINIPIVIVALIAGRQLLPTSRDPHAPRLDLVGTVLGALGLAATLFGIIEAPARGWTDSLVLGGFALGLTLLAAFVVYELRSDHPMLEIGFFKNRTFSGASLAITLVFFAMFGSMYFLTQYLQFVLGYSAMKAGAALIPAAGMMMLVAPNSARLTRYLGTRTTVALGLGGVATALAILTRATVGSGYGLIALVLAVLGAGMSMAMSPATEAIMGSIPKEKAGIGSAMNDTTRQVGGALGVAVLGSITAGAYKQSMAKVPGFELLPDPARKAVTDSIGGAFKVAQLIPQGADQIHAAARASFVDAMTHTLWFGAGIAVVGALVAFVFLPARPIDEIDVDSEQEAHRLDPEGHPAGAEEVLLGS